jgi:hypothetical protein
VHPTTTANADPYPTDIDSNTSRTETGPPFAYADTRSPDTYADSDSSYGDPGAAYPNARSADTHAHFDTPHTHTGPICPHTGASDTYLSPGAHNGVAGGTQPLRNTLLLHDSGIDVRGARELVTVH